MPRNVAQAWQNKSSLGCVDSHRAGEDSQSRDRTFAEVEASKSQPDIFPLASFCPYVDCSGRHARGHPDKMSTSEGRGSWKSGLTKGGCVNVIA